MVKHKENPNHVKNLKYISLAIVFIFFVCVVKVSYLAVLGYLKDFTPSNFTKKYNIRKDIIDRNGNVIALNVPSVSVFLNPVAIKNKSLAVQAIISTLGISESSALRMVNSPSSFVWVKRNITPSEELNLRYYGIIGINFEKEQKRFYPHGNLFSHIVGITDIDSNGISGVERSFNESIYDKPVETSLDLRIQLILYEALEKAKRINQAKSAYGIVLDPKTSEVLAMVSLPDYNPNDRATINDTNIFNYVTQGVFEPGSISKAFTTAIALDSGSARIENTYDVSRPIVKDSFLIVDFSHMDKSINVPEILMYSSNIGTSILMLDSGIANQKNYLERFGLLGVSEIELKEKANSLKPKKWTELTSITLSYGYGLGVTQATFANSFASMVNGGIYRPLTLLKRTSSSIMEERRVISNKTSSQIRAILRLTVAFGYGRRANVIGYAVGGKTGSSEKLINGRYQVNNVIASFAGVFPIHNPSYVVIISIDEPKRVSANNYIVTGGYLAAPVVSEIIEKISLSMGLPKQHDEVENINKNNSESLITYVNSIQDLEIN